MEVGGSRDRDAPRRPILEEEVPAAAAERTAHAAQVMAADPVCFAPLVTVGDAYDVLRSCRHACFPVVAGGGSTQLAGTVLRSTICMLIQHRAFGAPGDDPTSRNDLRTRALSPLLSSAVFERAYPRFPTVDELDVSETDRGCWLDLRPYADTGPVTIQDCASIQRTYRVFRTLGLRHLVVVDAGNKVRGIITRKDLDHHTLEERLAWAANEAENLESFSVEAHPSTMARFSVA